jgi:hypothetical protein
MPRRLSALILLLLALWRPPALAQTLVEVTGRVVDDPHLLRPTMRRRWCERTTRTNMTRPVSVGTVPSDHSREWRGSGRYRSSPSRGARAGRD